MLRRVEPHDAREARSPLREREVAETRAVVPAVPDVELETSMLPRDHPQWVKDTLSVSNRAREVLARLKPVFVKILTFWDHRVRSIFVGNARVSVDPSGSYRRE
jgi:cation transport regulator ChaC